MLFVLCINVQHVYTFSTSDADFLAGFSTFSLGSGDIDLGLGFSGFLGSEMVDGSGVVSGSGLGVFSFRV